MASLTLLCLLLTVWVSESTPSIAVQGPSSPSDSEEWTDHANMILNYSTHTAPGVCQLSTCELLLRELGATEQKLAHVEDEMLAMKQEMQTMRDRLQASEEQAQELAEVKTKVSAMEGELQDSQSEIEELKSKDGGMPMVQEIMKNRKMTQGRGSHVYLKFSCKTTYA